LVLAIGIVVDDAIVVVEAVHAKMAEEPTLTPYAAFRKVIGEISGTIVAITLLMAAVFVPVTFMTGPVGVFDQQFSLTMASSIVLSGVLALPFTPVLGAIILENHHGEQHHKRRTPVELILALLHQRDAALAADDHPLAVVAERRGAEQARVLREPKPRNERERVRAQHMGAREAVDERERAISREHQRQLLQRIHVRNEPLELREHGVALEAPSREVAAPAAGEALAIAERSAGRPRLHGSCANRRAI
jgi:hypothetical protein